jgi:hypothetical protein
MLRASFQQLRIRYRPLLQGSVYLAYLCPECSASWVLVERKTWEAASMRTSVELVRT